MITCRQKYNGLWLALVLVGSFATLGNLTAQADSAPAAEMTDGQQMRYQDLLRELRCLVCQNQSLFDSPAGLAQDLKSHIQAMMINGASDEEIKQDLLSRYGEFILYKPPLTAQTMVLWFLPFVLLLLAGVILFFLIRRQATVEPTPDKP